MPITADIVRCIERRNTFTKSHARLIIWLKYIASIKCHIEQWRAIRIHTHRTIVILNYTKRLFTVPRQDFRKHKRVRVYMEVIIVHPLLNKLNEE